MEVLNDAATIGRAIVVPGPSKYQDALVNTLFDEMRTAMNAALADAQALLCIGFGFNDDHLQGVIKPWISQTVISAFNVFVNSALQISHCGSGKSDDNDFFQF